ncbi:MAG: UvrD-helicase domain-containing protein [Ancrocorticia populi]|uniref:UvrD-helicase domain-containing protein n=2 Tax=Ancrocorticia populi TaxID=2175228 RepID=UPI003F8D9B4D
MTNYESIMTCLNPDFLPTPEQREVITSNSPAILVVAGAGSGKTATMANRIAYQIGTGTVRPGEVLGLTFTRKAAGELAQRVDQALMRLSKGGFLTSQGEGLSALRERMDRPNISTYNSFAADIAASYGMLVRKDPGARLITDAERWQLMEEIVGAWPTREEDEVLRESAQSTIISYSLSLASSLIDNQLTTDEAREFLAREIDALNRLEEEGKGVKLGKQDGVSLTTEWNTLRKKGLPALQRRRQMLDIVDVYLERKKQLGVVEFADQVATAAAVLGEHPALGEELAGRYRLVLLDEYQDTSINQADLLVKALGSKMGAWRSVCAVGDPYQAIYGWRGASASALADFAVQFRRHMGGLEELTLSTSFRNDCAILDAANAVALGIEDTALPVKKLEARKKAGPGKVTEIRTVLREDSYRAIAWRIKDVMAAMADKDGGAEIAVLCRKRKYIETIVEALNEVGVPYEIVGGESLLQRPEILTIRAALAAVATPGRNDRLMRLLTYVGIGASDLRALSAWAQEYAAHQLRSIHPGKESNGTGQAGGDGETSGASLNPRGEGTLIEALTYLPSLDWTSYRGEAFSEAGRAQLELLSGVLQSIRGAIHSDLSDLIAFVSQALGLDLAAATRASGGQRVRTSINSFIALGGSYQREHPGSSLADFLEWMETSDEKEHGGEDEAGIESARLDEDIEVRPGVVQIMTIHAAKGLEWRDLVAIPELVEGEFSDIESRVKSWPTQSETFPYPLRADYKYLPQFDPAQCEDRAEAAQGIYEFKKIALPEYESQEQRRLAYVAFTRPRAELLLAGYGLKSPEKAEPRTKGRGQNVVSEDPVTVQLLKRSTYLTDIRKKTDVTPFAELAGPDWPSELIEQVGEQAEVDWLVERLGEDAVYPPKLAPVPHYAEMPDLLHWPQSIQRKLDSLAPLATDADLKEWQWQADVLLAERRDTRATTLARPYYTATDMVHLSEDSEAFLANQRRPIPSKPSGAARLGTNMHAQIAHHFTEPATLDIDSLMELPASDLDMDSSREGQLYDAFLASPWAGCAPLAIEQSLEIVVADRIIRCTIDAVLDTSAKPGAHPITIVDWKTGRRPRNKDLPSRELQLALYRLAWSRAHKVPLDQIGACFVYLGEPESRRELQAGELTEEEITERIAAALN